MTVRETERGVGLRNGNVRVSGFFFGCIYRIRTGRIGFFFKAKVETGWDGYFEDRTRFALPETDHSSSGWAVPTGFRFSRYFSLAYLKPQNYA